MRQDDDNPDIEVDFHLLKCFQDFSAEILRLSLFGIAVYGVLANSESDWLAQCNP